MTAEEQPPVQDIPQGQSILAGVTATTIKTGHITQTIYNYAQKSPLLSSTINDEDLPHVKVWQKRPLEDDLASYLSNSQLRLVGLSGAGGYGKSALAAQIFQQHIGFTDSLWAGFRQPAGFGTFGRWLLKKLIGIDLYIQRQDVYGAFTDPELCNTLLTELRRRSCLLVMDNLETLLQSAELWQPYGDFIAQWLERGSNIDRPSLLLLTSQFRLELPTDNWRWEEVGGLETEQGVALLAQQGISGAPEDLRQFVEDAFGHPLLLQLAVSMLNRQKLRDCETPTITRLQQQDIDFLRSIRGQHRDVDTCVGEILDRNFYRQPPQMQQLLLRLVVLRGSFDLAAAQANANDGEVVTLEMLRSLADWSFLQERKESDGSWQFYFLPLIAKYLRDRAGVELAAGHEGAIRLYRAAQQSILLATEKSAEKIAFFEYSEIFYHLCELGRYAEAWQSVYYVGEKHGDLDRFLKLRGFNDIRRGFYERLANEWRPENPEEKQQFATMLRTLGDVLQFKKRSDEALEKYAAALEIYTKVGDRLGEANTLKAIGDVLQFKDLRDEALEKYAAALEIYTEVGARLGEANTLEAFGHLHFSSGSYAEALAIYQQAANIYQIIQDLYSTGWNLLYLARTQVKLGSAYEAQQSYQKAQEIFERIEMPEIAARCQTEAKPINQSAPGRVAPEIFSSKTDSPKTPKVLVQDSPPWQPYVYTAIIGGLLFLGIYLYRQQPKIQPANKVSYGVQDHQISSRAVWIVNRAVAKGLTNTLELM